MADLLTIGFTGTSKERDSWVVSNEQGSCSIPCLPRVNIFIHIIFNALHYMRFQFHQYSTHICSNSFHFLVLPMPQSCLSSTITPPHYHASLAIFRSCYLGKLSPADSSALISLISARLGVCIVTGTVGRVGEVRSLLMPN